MMSRGDEGDSVKGVFKVDPPRDVANQGELREGVRCPHPPEMAEHNSIFLEGFVVRNRNSRRRHLWSVITIVVSLTVAAVIAAVLIPHPGSSSQQPQPDHVPATATMKPAPPFPSTTTHPMSTPAPTEISRLESFRSLLMNYSVSSHDDLFNQTTPQYQALTWLVNDDKANLSVSTVASANEAILYRYILAAVYFANGGVGWDFDCNFLSAESICDWQDFPTQTGVLSCDPLQIKLGKETQPQANCNKSMNIL